MVMFGAKTCGTCRFCQRGQDNLCTDVAGIMGFHIDGFACEYVTMEDRHVLPVPAGVSLRDAATRPITYSTVEHMLIDNCKLEPGETVLVQAGGSGIGHHRHQAGEVDGLHGHHHGRPTTRRPRKPSPSAPTTPSTTAPSASRVWSARSPRRRASTSPSSTRRRYLQPVAVLPPARWPLATCGATSGATITFNLMQLFQQQYKIHGSFGAPNPRHR